MITKKHIGRPIDLHKCNGRKLASHGRIESVKNGVVRVVDVYIHGLHGNKENGNFTTYIDKKDSNVTIY